MRHPHLLQSLAIMAALLFSAQGTSARTVEYTVNAGFNIGATTPMGLPATVRKINSYNPTLNLMVGVNATQMLSPQWGIGAGLEFENKGMKTGIKVRNYHLTMDIVRGDVTGTHTGYFTGDIKNDTKIAYLTIPVYAVWRPRRCWEFDLGPYFAAAISRSFEGRVEGGTMRETPLEPAIGIDRAQYDYSTDISKFDMGLTAAASRLIYKGLSVRAALSWGVISTLKKSTRKIDMNTYNVYLNIGLGYTF